jgi:O-antigen ligase
MEKVAFLIYMAALVLAVLVFGAVHAYAYTTVFLGILVAAILVLVAKVDRDPSSRKLRIRFLKTALNPLFVLMFILLVFQTIPLPESMLRFLSLEALVVGKKSLPASEVLAAENPNGQWFALAPYGFPVRQSIMRWTAYGLLFWGLSQTLTSSRRIETAIFIVLITGCFEALYGLMQTYSGLEHIWWFKKTDYLRSITGTYVNRNHFAGLMEMGLLLMAGFAGALEGSSKKRPGAFAGKAPFRARVLAIVSMEELLAKRVLIVFSGVVMGIGLIFSASRGGMIAMAAAMLVMGVLFLARQKHRRKGLVLVLIFVLTAVYAAHIGIDYPLERFKSFDADFENRTRCAQKTLEMFENYRLMGIGVGNFRYAYPKYQAVEDKKVFFEYAHNDWVQFLTEAGIIGFGLLLCGVLYYIYQTIKIWSQRNDPFAVCLGLTPLAVMAAMAVHSYSDFNFHIPANCIMFAVILAVGHSALHLKRDYRPGKVHYQFFILPLKPKGFVVLLLLGGLVLWTGAWTVRHFVAETYCNTVPNRTLNLDQNPSLTKIQKAIAWDGHNAAYWYKLAEENMRIRKIGDRGPGAENMDQRVKSGEQGAGDRSQDQRKSQMGIVSALERAVELNPFNAQYHLLMGWEYSYLWREHDYHRNWLPAGDISMERAGYFAGEKDSNLHMEIGKYWTMRSKTINPANLGWESAWTRSCWHYQKALELESGEQRKQMIQQIKSYIWLHYPDEYFVKEALGSVKLPALTGGGSR